MTCKLHGHHLIMGPRDNVTRLFVHSKSIVILPVANYWHILMDVSFGNGPPGYMVIVVGHIKTIMMYPVAHCWYILLGATWTIDHSLEMFLWKMKIRFIFVNLLIFIFGRKISTIDNVSWATCGKVCQHKVCPGHVVNSSGIIVLWLNSVCLLLLTFWLEQTLISVNCQRLCAVQYYYWLLRTRSWNDTS